MNDINQIINDILVLEPSLKGKEEELRKIISSLLTARPNIVADEAFASELKARLLKTFELKVSRNAVPSPFYKWRFALIGAVVTVVIVVPVTVSLSGLFTGTPSFDLSNVTVNEKGSSAFGPLAVSTEAVSQKDTANTAPVAAGSRMGVMSFALGQVETPNLQTGPRFSYVGTPLALATNGLVYHRVVDRTISQKIGEITSGIKTGLVDFSTFSNLNGNYVSLVESDTEHGYAITFNPQQEEVDIGAYWSGAPPTNNDTTDTILTADTAKSLATQFFLDHNISTQPYGDLVIPTTENFGVFGNDTNSIVILPLIVEGNMVVQDGGVPYGVNVTIDQNLKQVMAVSGIMSRHYESSSYPLLSSLDEVLARAEKQIYGFETGAQTKLDTPEKVLLHFSKFNQVDGQEDSYLVPALRFPIVGGESPTTSHYIVVPITTDDIE